MTSWFLCVKYFHPMFVFCCKTYMIKMVWSFNPFFVIVILLIILYDNYICKTVAHSYSSLLWFLSKESRKFVFTYIGETDQQKYCRYLSPVHCTYSVLYCIGMSLYSDEVIYVVVRYHNGQERHTLLSCHWISEMFGSCCRTILSGLIKQGTLSATW